MAQFGMTNSIGGGAGKYTSIDFKDYMMVFERGNTWTKLNSSVTDETGAISSEQWHNDDGTYYTIDTANGTIKVNTAGSYRITAKLRWRNEPNGFWVLGIFNGNDLLAESPIVQTGGTYRKSMGAEMSITVSCSANDVISLGYYGSISYDYFEEIGESFNEIAGWNHVSYLQVEKISS